MLTVWDGTQVLLRHSSIWDSAVPQERPWAHPISAFAVHSRKSLLSGPLGSISFSYHPPASVHWNSSMRVAVDWKGIGRRLLPAIFPPAIANCHAIEPRRGRIWSSELERIPVQSGQQQHQLLRCSSVTFCLLSSVYQSKGRISPRSYSMSQTKGLPSKPCPLYESKMVKTEKYLFRSSSEFNIFKLEPRQPCFCAIFLCLGAVIAGRIRGTKVKPD